MQFSSLVHRLQKMARVFVVIMLIVPGLQLRAQTALWETLIKQGNAALATRDIKAAQRYYNLALDLTEKTVATDLAPYTTLRNIAQSFVLDANLDYADSIYSVIIPKISDVLVTEHPYRLQLLAEQADIREAIRQASIIPEPVVIGLSFWELM